MQNRISFLAIAVLLHSSTALQCWNCQNGNGDYNCSINGFIETCPSDNDVCERETRVMNGVSHLFQRCKQRAACFNRMTISNAVDCKPKSKHSACVCCCNTDLCNIGEDSCQGDATAVDVGSPGCRRLKNQTVAVECSNGYKIGSHCELSCPDNKHNLYPPGVTSLQCLPTQEWDKQMPCCTRPCPPYAKIDFIIVKSLASTSNDSKRTSDEIGRYIYSRLDNSVENGFRLAIVRYSRDVHLVDVVKFNEFITPRTQPNSEDGLINMGRALRWAYENLRGPESGNRPDALDIVVLVTDTTPTDDAAVPAQEWRNAGALVYVERQLDDDGNHASYDYLLDVVKDPSKIFSLRDRSSAAVEEMVDDELNDICTYRCL